MVFIRNWVDFDQKYLKLIGSGRWRLLKNWLKWAFFMKKTHFWPKWERQWNLSKVTLGFLTSQSKVFLIWLLYPLLIYAIVNPTEILKFFFDFLSKIVFEVFSIFSKLMNFSGNFLFKFSWNKSLFAFDKFPDV